MKALIYFGILYAIINTAIAATWIGPYTISTIEANGTVVYFYKPSETVSFSNPHSCSDPSWVTFHESPALVDRALSVGLLAQASGQKVKFYANGCIGSHINATVIQINKSW